MHRYVGCLALLSCAGMARAGEIPARETILIQAGHVVVRPGKVLDGASVLIRDGRIVAVGTGIDAPSGARVIEGGWVCAAYLDAWSALGMGPDSLAELSSSAATRAVDGYDPYSLDHLRAEALRAGVTAVRVQAGPAARVGGLGGVVRVLPGLEAERRVVSAASNVWMTAGLSMGGQPQLVETPDGFQFVTGERAQDPFERMESVDRIVSALQSGKNYLIASNEHRHELADWEKKIAEKEAEYDKDFKKAKKDREKAQKEAEEKGKKFEEKKYKEDKKPSPPRYDEDNEVLAQAIDGRMPVVVHAEREAEVRALLAGTEPHERLRLILAGGSESAWHAAKLAERQVRVLVAPLPLGRNRPDEFADSDLSLAGRLARDGVRVLLGSGGRDPSATRDLPLLAGLAIAHGLARDDAFAALTVRAAQAFDVSDRIGTLEPGKDAEVIVLNGPPLETTSRVLYTISDGRVVVTPEG